MAELTTKEGRLTTADLASFGIPPKQSDKPTLVKVQERVSLDKAAAVSKPMPLFSESEMGEFRSQWSSIQTGFVDEPRRTGEKSRHAGSFGHAATRGRFCQRAIGPGKAVGKRRQRIH